MAEDLLASPCVACDHPAAYVVVWKLTRKAIIHELAGNGPNARRIFYRLYDACERRCQHDHHFVTTVEDEILKLWRAGYVHRVQSA